jgi:anti-sigma B factor antagonist
MQKLVEDSPSFRALLHEAHGVQVLRVSGEIDLHSVPRFQDALEKAVAAAQRDEASSSAGVLVVDLSELGFMDSMGLGTLIGSTEEFREGGGEVRLVVLGGEVMRVLEVTGMGEALRVYPDVPSAVENRRRAT